MSPTEEHEFIRKQAERETQSNGWPMEYKILAAILWAFAIASVLLAIFWPS